MSETLETMIARDRAAAVRWAREVLEDERAVILDTETTGLHAPVDFVEIGVIDRKGRELFHSLVSPAFPVTIGASDVHGYRTEDLKGMPDFDELFPALYALLYPRRVVVYNAKYDRMVLDEAVAAYAHEPTDLPPWECAMQRYAEYVGDWNQKRRSYRWQRLEGGDHSAIGDCRAALEVIREMAGSSGGEKT